MRGLYDRRAEENTEYPVVINADGSHLHVLPNPVLYFYDRAPGLWSPDGKSIAFSYSWWETKIVNATTGAVIEMINYRAQPPVDWQALPGGRRVACADRGSAPLSMGPRLTSAPAFTG